MEKPLQVQTIKKFCLSAERFEGMVNALDAYIRRAFERMEEKQSSEAAITMKINIETEKRSCADGGDINRRIELTVPDVKWRIGMNIKSQFKNDGKIADQTEAVLQTPDGCYVVPIEEAMGQISVFDAMEAE